MSIQPVMDTGVEEHEGRGGREGRKKQLTNLLRSAQAGDLPARVLHAVRLELLPVGGEDGHVVGTVGPVDQGLRHDLGLSHHLLDQGRHHVLAWREAREGGREGKKD